MRQKESMTKSELFWNRPFPSHLQGSRASQVQRPSMWMWKGCLFSSGTNSHWNSHRMPPAPAVAVWLCPWSTSQSSTVLPFSLTQLLATILSFPFSLSLIISLNEGQKKMCHVEVRYPLPMKYNVDKKWIQKSLFFYFCAKKYFRRVLWRLTLPIQSMPEIKEDRSMERLMDSNSS